MSRFRYSTTYPQKKIIICSSQQEETILPFLQQILDDTVIALERDNFNVFESACKAFIFNLKMQHKHCSTNDNTIDIINDFLFLVSFYGDLDIAKKLLEAYEEHHILPHITNTTKTKSINAAKENDNIETKKLICSYLSKERVKANTMENNNDGEGLTEETPTHNNYREPFFPQHIQMTSEQMQWTPSPPPFPICPLCYNPTTHICPFTTSHLYRYQREPYPYPQFVHTDYDRGTHTQELITAGRASATHFSPHL